MRLARAAPRGDRIRDPHDLLDEAVEEIGAGEERGGIPGVVVEVAVQRDQLDLVEAVLQHGVLPGPEGRHVAARGAAGGELDAGIEPLHHFRGLGRDPAVLGGRLGRDLPGPVHLVAEAPELHAVRLLEAMGAAQVGERAAARVVAVLEQPARGIRPAGAEVDREHRLDPGRAAPGDELVGAEGVGLGRQPGEVEAPGPLLERADAVLPVVAGDEVAAGIAHHRGAELAHQRQHVLAEPLRVGGRVAGLEDAAVDAAAEVLDEGAEQAAVGRADRGVPIEQDPGGAHAGGGYWQITLRSAWRFSTLTACSARSSAAGRSAARLDPLAVAAARLGDHLVARRGLERGERHAVAAHRVAVGVDRCGRLADRVPDAVVEHERQHRQALAPRPAGGRRPGSRTCRSRRPRRRSPGARGRRAWRRAPPAAPSRARPRANG